MNASQILSKSDQLSRLRSSRVKSRLVGVKDDYVVYRASSVSISRYYDVWIKLIDFPRHPDFGTDQDFLFALDGDIKIHSSCPDFLYHAYQYWSTRQSIAIYPEVRKPTRNHVNGGVLVCKHLISVLKQFLKDRVMILSYFQSLYHNQ